VIVPYESLNQETLTNLIEEFVSRDGTDYGTVEIAIEDKVSRVHDQLARGETVIVYDAESESCNLVHRDWAQKQGLFQT